MIFCIFAKENIIAISLDLGRLRHLSRRGTSRHRCIILCCGSDRLDRFFLVNHKYGSIRKWEKTS